MSGKRKELYLKSLCLALGLTIALHFFILMLLAGYNAFNSPFVIPFEQTGLKRSMLTYSFLSIFLLLGMEFLASFKIQGNSRRFKLGWISLAVFAIAIMYGLVMMNVYHGVYSLEEDLNARIYLGGMMGNGLLGIMVVLISYLDFVVRKQRKIAVENESLKAQNLQSRYEALRSQIDPHFLFNTFSSLTSMIELDPARAQEFSIRMSSVLRYTLQNKDAVTLSEEIEFTKDYCLLMQIRYGENLKFRFSVDPQYDNYCLVPLSVQTLVENAVKHNEISNRSPMTVSIHTNPDCTLTVSNPINSKRGSSRGTGLGLANLMERYQLKFAREVKVYSNDKVFMVTIPLVSTTTGTR